MSPLFLLLHRSVEDIHRNDNTNNDGAAVDYDDFPGNCSNIVCRFLPLVQPIVTMMVMLGEKMAHRRNTALATAATNSTRTILWRFSSCVTNT